MKVFTKKHLLWGLLLMIPSFFFAQDLHNRARAVGDSAIVRWLPSSYDIWQTGISNGYRVVITQLDGSGNIVDVSMTDTIYPTPEGNWGDISGNDILGLAHALLYDNNQLNYEGAQGAFTQTQDRQTRFNFAVLAADMSVEAAQHLGLAYIHENIDPTHTYEYTVRLVGNSQIAASALVDPANTPALPQPDSLSAAFGDGEVVLAWHKGNLQSFYTTYDIEYSTDGGLSFSLMNNRPFINMETEEMEQASYFFYHHAIDNKIAEYQFRIRGRSSFGEYGPYSAIVSGSGQPTPLPIYPVITEVTELIDSSFRVEWTLDESYVDSIDHINVWSYDDFPNTHSVLNASPLSNTIREFIDENANPINYYKLEVVDINGASSYSPIAIGERYDSIPPLPPVGLTGLVDTILDSVSIIRLAWTPNAESDLAGYHVYVSNGPDLEFAPLTSAGLATDTVFQDTILNFTLGETIYYKLRAVDFTGNISDFSDVLAVERPDLIPPVPPVFVGSVARSEGGFQLDWINSPSEDVVGYRLQRRPVDQPDAGWETIYSGQVANQRRAGYRDQAATEEGYWYRIMVSDDAGNVSISEPTRYMAPVIERYRSPTDAPTLSTQVQGGKALLSWELPDLTDLSNVVIYKSINGGPLRSLVRISTNELATLNQEGTLPYSYLDRFCTEGNNYAYFLQLCYQSGTTSNTSEAANISF